MKKFSVIVLAIALVMMMSVPFAASADAAVNLIIPETTVEVGTETVEVVVNFETTEYMMDGGIIITYPTDKVEVIIAEKETPFDDPLNYMASKDRGTSDLPNGEVQVDPEAGTVKVAFMNSTPITTQSGKIATINFKILDASVAGEIELAIEAERLVVYEDGNASGNNLVTDEEKFANTGKIIVKEAEASTEPTEEPTEAPTTEPTTKKPAPTGEATPWALMATVAVAGAALVVLSTKKSK